MLLAITPPNVPQWYPVTLERLKSKVKGQGQGCEYGRIGFWPQFQYK